MTLAIGLFDGQSARLMILTWPRIEAATVALIGWLLVALIMPILAIVCDVVLFAAIGPVALPIALAALGLVIGLAIDETKGTQ